MKAVYIDCIGGASGDMILGALIDAGLDPQALKENIEELNVGKFDIMVEQTRRSGIPCTHITVKKPDDTPQRNLADIRSIIKGSGFSEHIKEQSIKIFTRLAEAESIVHKVPVEEIHFHEVGAVDAIIDIVGTVWGLEYLGISHVFCSPIKFGTGMVTCAHGVLPVPVPAVVELTKGFPVVRTGVVGEMTTPTGAAILTTLAHFLDPPGGLCHEAVGYGAGSAEFPEIPNILRVFIGSLGSLYEEDHSVVVETNIDDMNPEVYGYLVDRVIEEGAKDAYLISTLMKKGRPGILFSAITDPEKLDRVVKMLLEETTTLGVRISHVTRKKLPRETIRVNTPWGEVRVKVAHHSGSRRFSPEFEDCRRIAHEKNIPILDVYQSVMERLSGL